MRELEGSHEHILRPVAQAQGSLRPDRFAEYLDVESIPSVRTLPVSPSWIRNGCILVSGEVTQIERSGRGPVSQVAVAPVEYFYVDGVCA